MRRRSFLKGLVFAACLPLAQALCVPDAAGVLGSGECEPMTLKAWAQKFGHTSSKEIVELLSGSKPALDMGMKWKEASATECFYDAQDVLRVRMKLQPSLERRTL